MDKKIMEIARSKSEQLFRSEHGQIKATAWICGEIKLPESKQANCMECNDIIFYDPTLEKNCQDNCKKICMKCAYFKHFEELSAYEQQFFIRIAKAKGWEIKKL
jgi:hypothetical protein